MSNGIVYTLALRGLIRPLLCALSGTEDNKDHSNDTFFNEVIFLGERAPGAVNAMINVLLLLEKNCHRLFLKKRLLQNRRRVMSVSHPDYLLISGQVYALQAMYARIEREVQAIPVSATVDPAVQERMYTLLKDLMDAIDPTANTVLMVHGKVVRGSAEAVAFATEAGFCMPQTCPQPAKKVPVPSGECTECANCAVPQGSAGITLKKCSRCKLVSYCSKACQSQHWKQGDHKRYCVAVGDRVPDKGAAAVPDAVHEASDKCTICLAALKDFDVTALHCGHYLHTKCWQELFSFEQAMKCPVCRSEFA
jgi:hypothetical protein